MTSLGNSEQRKLYRSVSGQGVPTYQMTCKTAILPRGNGTARGRQVEYGETDANFNVYDIHNCNCILPYERFEASFDLERGEFYPMGSRGLLRKVKATTSGGICTNVPCMIETESEEVGSSTCRELIYETEINVWATSAIVQDEIFWVSYQNDRDKPLPEGTPEIAAAFGRWVPVSNNQQRNGVVHGTAEFEFSADTANVDVLVTFSELPDVNAGEVVTAINYIGYEGDQDGECFVYYHGDGTGNGDGTYSLMGARCPT